MYVIAPAYSEEPVWKCQRCLPVRASNAIRLPDAPAKTRPDAVESTPAQDWLVYGNSQRRSPVVASIARSPLCWPALRRCTAPPRNPTPGLESAFPEKKTPHD